MLTRTAQAAHRDPGGDEVAFVEHEDEVLPRLLLLQVAFNVLRARANGVTSIQHLDDDVRGVNHLWNGSHSGLGVTSRKYFGQTCSPSLVTECEKYLKGIMWEWALVN